MAIIMSQPMTAQEIRVLQEYRRLAAETLTAEAIRGIRHPVGGGEEPAHSLAAKGYLTSVDGASFTLTQKGKDFLALDVKPETE
jgi:hypothetical protein